MVIHQFGEPEVMLWEEAETPVPGPGEVLVKVHSVSVNRTLDLQVRQDGGGYGAILPLVLGNDPAGVVAETGPGVESLRVNDRVAIFPGYPLQRLRPLRRRQPPGLRQPADAGHSPVGRLCRIREGSRLQLCQHPRRSVLWRGYRRRTPLSPGYCPDPPDQSPGWRLGLGDGCSRRPGQLHCPGSPQHRGRA